MAYNALSSEDVVLSSEAVTTPMWSDGTNVLETFNTSSIQVMGLSGDYYLDVYKDSNPGTGSVVEFACTFADKYGRGAAPYDDQVPENTPARTIFGQYRSLVLGDEESDFYFGGSGSTDSISSSYFWVVNIDRARYKESLMPGTFNLILSGSGTTTFSLVDDSTIQGSARYIDSGQVFNLVEAASGSIFPDPTKANVSYGYLLPDIGTILIDGKSVAQKIGINTGSLLSNNDMDDSIAVFLDKMVSFTLQAKETVTSNYVFIRAKNSEFNYSMNPSNITSTGELRHKIMANSPETYITSIGLYNSNNDLVAVAKLSRPLPKNFTKEALFRIKLDY